MRIALTLLSCGLMLTANLATPQSTLPPNADDGQPWGGVLSPWPTQSSTGDTKHNHQPLVSSFCVTSGNNDPCVLTGQYNRYRNSNNPKEASLARFSNGSFGLAYLYQINNPPTGLSLNYEPVIAQPLYATNLSYGGGSHNMLIVASLADYVYAFDTTGSTTSNVITPLWSVSLLGGSTATSHCNSKGQVFVNSLNGLPGAANLPYYGVVATPVIDAPSTSVHPTLFVVSACVPSDNTTQISWVLDAIDLTTGAIVGTPQTITATNFTPTNQLSRASLLVTHPSGAGITPYIYVSFGTGVKEIGDETDNTYQYTGWLFGYTYSYSMKTFSAITGSPFATECAAGSGCATGTYPVSPYTGFTPNYPDGPAAPGSPPTYCTIPSSGASNCSPGSNWGVNGAGLWQSSWGPSATSASNVYITAGNGAFACSSTGGGQNGCLTASGVQYWGEATMQLPAGNGSSPMTVYDFFAPSQLWYTCPYGTTCSGPNMPNVVGTFVTDPLTTGSTNQSQEINRLDLDRGVGGTVLLPHSTSTLSTCTFSMTNDKSSYLTVMPPALGEGCSGTSGLGQFQSGDAGLNGSSLTYTTQASFQINRQPSAALGNYTCEHVTAHGAVHGACDEVHELAWFSTYDPTNSTFYDLLLVWPMAEAVENFLGTFGSPYQSYSFGTSANFDLCPLTSSGFTSSNCTGANPPFPLSSGSGSSSGAPMAAATQISQTTPSLNAATLWAVVPQVNSGGGNIGSLYGYKINANPTGSSFGSLGTAPVWYWNPALDTGTQCTHVPDSITSWYPPTFTEPTVADNNLNSPTAPGALYVPTVCVVNDGSTYPSCDNAQKNFASILNGVLVFATCD